MARAVGSSGWFRRSISDWIRPSERRVSETPLSRTSAPPGLARWIPALTWLRSYERGWLRADIVAGIMLAAYLLPGGIGDASLANLPPEAGIYAFLFSGLVFWLFCSSQHAAVTVTSAISLLIGSSLGTLAAASWLRLEARGVKLLGEVPQGVPMPGLPAIHWRDLNELLSLAMACFLLGAIESAAIGRMFAAKHGGRFDSNQELLALAAANLAAGLGRGFPVSGGMSQSLVNESGGARTPLSGLIASGIVLLVAVFLSGLLYHLPQPVLAAVVLVAVTGLFKISALKRLWGANRSEFAVAFAALLGILGSGLLRGVLIGAIISLVLLLRHGMRPHVAFLGRIPGTRRFSDLERHPDNEIVPMMLIFRPESSLIYFNVEHVRDRIMERICLDEATPRLVLCDLSASPDVDLHGAEMLLALARELRELGIRLQIVEARAGVRDMLRREGLEGRVGCINRHTSVAEAVENFQNA